MRLLIVSLVVVFLIFASYDVYAHNPPKGIDWKEDLQSGKLEAAAKKLPIMMYVADDGANSNTMSASLIDPQVMRMLRHFVCVFVSNSYNLQKFQQSYVPWIGATPQTTHQPPLLIFGDSAGNAHQEFRIEGKALKPEELLAHLEKVLRTLAPDEAKMASDDALKSMTLSECCERLEVSLSFLEKNLSAEMLVQFQEEVRSALNICKFVRTKMGKIKEEERKNQAVVQLKNLERSLEKLSRFRGKEKEKEECEGHLKKAREALSALSLLVGEQEFVKGVLACKAIPKSKAVSTDDVVKADLLKIEGVKDVSFEKTEEQVKVQDTEFKITIFKIICEKDVKRVEIEKVFDKHGYEARWGKN